MTTSPTSFDYAFQPKTATDLVSIKGDAKQVLHAVSDAATVEEAMSLMQTHRLRALPVFRIAMTKDPANAANRVRYHQFISMLTLLDILTFATLRPLFVDSEPKDYTEDPERIAAVRQRRKAFLQLSKGTDLLYRPISDVLDIATTEQSIREFNAGDSLLTLLQVLTYDTHHALVKERDDPTSPVAMVTQSDALKMLIDSADSEIRKFQSSITCEQVMSRKPGTTTNDAGTTDAPLYMQNERSAFSCYKAMFRGKVDSLAIVTAQPPHKLIANLSASDLRELPLTEDFADLILLPVDQFLSKLHGKLPEPLCVKPGDSLRSAMEIISEKRVHRVWVVNEAGTPQGVVTITDCLKPFVSEPQPEPQSEEAVEEAI